MDLRRWKRRCRKNHNELLLGDAACQAPKEGKYECYGCVFVTCNVSRRRTVDWMTSAVCLVDRALCENFGNLLGSGELLLSLALRGW